MRVVSIDQHAIHIENHGKGIGHKSKSGKGKLYVTSDYDEYNGLPGKWHHPCGDFTAFGLEKNLYFIGGKLEV
jgi:hypothetical protein